MKAQILSAVFGLTSIAYAQTQTFCPQEESGICFAVNIPASTASSNQGDVFFQIQGPASKQYIAFGQGGGMKGANIFVVYSNADNSNVTLSPRLGTGHQMPEFNSAAQATLLDGSGIANGVMTANVRCSSCASWSGGSMTFTDSQSSWIWAVNEGSSISSSSVQAVIAQHSNQGVIRLDLTQATGGNSVNPFTQTSSSGSASPSASSNGTSSGASSSDDSASEDMYKRMVIAHGLLMSLTFVVLFPIGALIIRVLSFSGLVWVHAAAQIFAYLIALAGFGIGVWMANSSQQLTATHPIIGIVVTGVLLCQPFLGLIHHILWRREKRRTLTAHVHIWLGRAALILAVINGGLGLQLSDNSVPAEIAYGVISGVFFVLYVAIVGLSSVRSRGKRSGETGQKVLGSRSPTESAEGVNREYK